MRQEFTRNCRKLRCICRPDSLHLERLVEIVNLRFPHHFNQSSSVNARDRGPGVHVCREIVTLLCQA